VFVPPLPANVAELRTRITAVVAQVTPEMLLRLWQHIEYRWDVCRITNGSHITIRGKTRCVLIYYDISKHCTCPLNKFIYSFEVLKLVLKHPILLIYHRHKLLVLNGTWVAKRVNEIWHWTITEVELIRMRINFFYYLYFLLYSSFDLYFAKSWPGKEGAGTSFAPLPATVILNLT
jgi:hypothetical protein